MIIKLSFRSLRDRVIHHLEDKDLVIGNNIIIDDVICEYIGKSRIDGYPLFKIEEHNINYLQENKNKWGIDNIQTIAPLEDNRGSYYEYKKPNREIKRVYSEADPYGEEDWNN